MPQYLICTFSSPRENLLTRDFGMFASSSSYYSSSSSENPLSPSRNSLCADFSTERFYRRRRCDQSPSDRFSLVPRCCSRSWNSCWCTLNDAICCQLSMCGWLGVTRGRRVARAHARRLSVGPLPSTKFSPPSSVLAGQTIASLVPTLHEDETGVLIYN